jgi:hypothetical protein
MVMVWIVYTLRDPRTHEIRYVGQTCGRTAEVALELRLRGHLAETRAWHRPKDGWLNDLRAAGLAADASVVDVYPERPERALRRDIERKWIEACVEAGHRLFNRRLMPPGSVPREVHWRSGSRTKGAVAIAQTI